MYHQMRDDLELWVRALSGEEVLKQADAILARLVRLAQLASNPELIDASYNETPAKLAALDTLLAEYMKDPDQKVIVWSSFVGNITAIAARYPRYDPVSLHGAVSVSDRNSIPSRLC